MVDLGSIHENEILFGDKIGGVISDVWNKLFKICNNT
jgi:hypothetical protein